MSELLEPIEGVSIEAYGELQAARASGIPEEAFIGKLNEHNNMDLEKFGRVEKEWNDRMAADATGAIATAYAAGFSSSGSGKFGAIGQSCSAQWQEMVGYKDAKSFADMSMEQRHATMAKNMMERYSTPPVQDEQEEISVSFEKYCEIQGAQQAWAETGQDVNAMLRETFDMNACDWSSLSTFYSMKFIGDPSMAMQFQELTTKYKSQYKGSSASPDDDIDF